MSGFDAEHGDDVRAAEKVLYMALIDEVRPLADARELIEDLERDGHAVVLASSAKPDEVEHYLDLLDARELVDGWTHSGDVERTKPHPDLVAAARREGRRRRGGDGRRLDVGLRGGRARRAADHRRADRRLQRAGAAGRGRDKRLPARSASCANGLAADTVARLTATLPRLHPSMGPTIT